MFSKINYNYNYIKYVLFPFKTSMLAQLLTIKYEAKTKYISTVVSIILSYGKYNMRIKQSVIPCYLRPID